MTRPSLAVLVLIALAAPVAACSGAAEEETDGTAQAISGDEDPVLGTGPGWDCGKVSVEMNYSASPGIVDNADTSLETAA